MVLCLLVTAATYGCDYPSAFPASSGVSQEVSSIADSPSLRKADSSANAECQNAPKPVTVVGNTSAQVQAASEGAVERSSECTETVPEIASLTAVPQSGNGGNGFDGTNLIDVVAPSQKLKLAEKNDIHLRVYESGLSSIGITQYQGDIKSSSFSEIPGSYSQVPVTYQTDGSAVIQVTPLRLGDVWLVIRGGFPNGGLFVKRVMVEVELSSRQPQRLMVAGGSGLPGTTRISLYLHKQPLKKVMQVFAFYDGIETPIAIDASAVVYKMRTNDDKPPVELDETTGLLTPIHVGHALVESSFARLKALTCVVVEENFGPSTPADDHSQCQELLQDGEHLTRRK
jgi:hypothetical protein